MVVGLSVMVSIPPQHVVHQKSFTLDMHIICHTMEPYSSLHYVSNLYLYLLIQNGATLGIIPCHTYNPSASFCSSKCSFAAS